MLLKDLYNAILSNPDKWKYYSGMNNEYTLEDLFTNEAIAKEFIESYFQAGDKLLVLYDEHAFGMNGKWTHTVSVFLLGIALSELLNIDFSEVTNGNKKNLYHWFLTCLYHDYGYTIESKSNEYIPLGYTLISFFKNYLGGKSYPKMRRGTSEFPTKVRNKYYKFCIGQLHFINHGIIGGLLLYSQLLENLNYKILEHGGKKHFYDNGLYYSINQKKDFALCADAIIAHNIWFDVSPIAELRLCDNQKHTYKRWLTALLVICDTIDPIKFFNHCNPISVLENIDIEIDASNNTLTISSNVCSRYNEYVEKCESLQQWTYVTSQRSNTNSITLINLRALYQ